MDEPTEQDIAAAFLIRNEALPLAQWMKEKGVSKATVEIDGDKFSVMASARELRNALGKEQAR